MAISAHGDGFVAPPNLRLPMTARIHTEKLEAARKAPRLDRSFYSAHIRELLR
jgi:hypothetical protein